MHEFPSACPWCSKPFTHTTAVEDNAAPSQGDITMCVGCGEWSVFETASPPTSSSPSLPPRLRKPTDEEFVAIGLDPDARKLRDVWSFVMRKGPARPPPTREA